MAERKPILTVTKDDCEWSFTRGTGAGGQKRNKTSSAVHCAHPASGAHGYSEASRSQAQNRRDAFTKMASSVEFQRWVKLETARRLGKIRDIESEVERMMQPRHLKVEIRQDGKWAEMSASALEGIE